MKRQRTPSGSLLSRPPIREGAKHCEQLPIFGRQDALAVVGLEVAERRRARIALSLSRPSWVPLLARSSQTNGTRRTSAVVGGSTTMWLPGGWVSFDCIARSLSSTWTGELTTWPGRPENATSRSKRPAAPCWNALRDRVYPPGRSPPAMQIRTRPSASSEHAPRGAAAPRQTRLAETPVRRVRRHIA
jgi:hypothetical protein